MKAIYQIIYKIGFYFCLPLFILMMIAYFTRIDWRSASMDSANIAVKAIDEEKAIVQIYVARTINWQGWFSVHSWIATKERNAKSYKTYHVIGFYLKRIGKTVIIKQDLPDRKWYGAMPSLIFQKKGEIAEKMIPEIEKIANNYPYNHKYHAWPGPNSNTFISYIIRNVEGFDISLPSNAIGKDYLPLSDMVSRSESKTGYQFSFLGLLGLTIGKIEGIEINILGLCFGIDFINPAIKLPLIGRVGKPYKID